MRRREILRLWSQIVHQTGIDKYTSAEWQENYEDFWRCMKSPTDPYIRIESIEDILKDQAELGHPLQPPKLTAIAKHKSQTKANQTLPHNYVDSEPLSMLRKRIKLDANAKLAANESKLIEEKEIEDSNQNTAVAIERPEFIKLSAAEKGKRTTQLEQQSSQNQRIKMRTPPKQKQLEFSSCTREKVHDKWEKEIMQQITQRKQHRPVNQKIKQLKQEFDKKKPQKPEIDKKKVYGSVKQKGQEKQVFQPKQTINRKASPYQKKISKKQQKKLDLQERDAKEQQEQQRELEELLQKISLPIMTEFSRKKVKKVKALKKLPVAKIVKKVSEKQAQPKDTNKPQLKDKDTNEKQDRVRTRSQRAERAQEKDQREQQKELQQQQQTQQQQQLNVTKSKHCQLKQQSKAMHDGKEQAHLSSTAIDLRAVAAAAPEPSSHIVPIRKAKLRPLPQAEDLSLPKCRPPIENDKKQRQFSVSESTDDPNEYIDVETPVAIFSKADFELEDLLINEAIQLPAPQGPQLDLGQLLAEDADKCETLASGAEEIDHCLESFNDKTPSKTPLELDTIINNVLIYDPDDDDEDVISVATSWDGDEDSLIDVEKINENTTKDQQKKPEESPATVTNAGTTHLDELLSYRIPKKAAGQPEREPLIKETPQLQLPPVEVQQQQVVRKQQQPKEQSAVIKGQMQQLPTIGNQQHPAIQNQPQPPPQQPIIRSQQQQPIVRNQQQQFPMQQQQVNRYSTDHQPQTCLRNAGVTALGPAQTQATPIFAPPYRLPAEPAVSAQSGILNIYRCQESKLSVFGIKCWRMLDGRCDQLNCNHALSSLGEVQRRLGQLKIDQLCDAYSLMLRHGILFRHFFVIFAEVFGNRKMRSHLLKMVEDCGLYMAFSGNFVTELYYLLIRFEVTPQAALAQIMEHLWRPNIGRTYPQLAGQLLHILAAGDWFNYIPNIKHLFDEQAFPIPVNFMATIARDAVAKDEQALVQKVWELVLFSPIDRNDDTLSVVIKILQNWRGSAEADLQQQQQLLSQRFGTNLQVAANVDFTLAQMMRPTVDYNIDVSMPHF